MRRITWWAAPTLLGLVVSASAASPASADPSAWPDVDIAPGSLTSIESVWIDEVNQRVVACSGVPATNQVKVASAPLQGGEGFGTPRIAALTMPAALLVPGHGDPGCLRNVRWFDHGSKFAVVGEELRVYESTSRAELGGRTWQPVISRYNTVLFDGARDRSVVAGLRGSNLYAKDYGVTDVTPPEIALGDDYVFDLAVSPDGSQVALLTLPDGVIPAKAETFIVRRFSFSGTAITAGAVSTSPTDGFEEASGQDIYRSSPTWLVIDDDGTVVVGTRRTWKTVSTSGGLGDLDPLFRLDRPNRAAFGRPVLLRGRRLAFAATAQHSPTDDSPIANEAYIYSIDDDSFVRIPNRNETSLSQYFGISADGRAVAFQEPLGGERLVRLVADTIDNISVEPADLELIAGPATRMPVTITNSGPWSVVLDEVLIGLGANGTFSCPGPVAVAAGSRSTCEAAVAASGEQQVAATVAVAMWGSRRDLGRAGTVSFFDGPAAPTDVRLVEEHGAWRVRWTRPDWRGARTRRYVVQFFYDVEGFDRGGRCGPDPDGDGFSEEFELSTPADPFVICGSLDPRWYDIEVIAVTESGSTSSGRLPFSTRTTGCAGYWMFDGAGRVYPFGGAFGVDDVFGTGDKADLVAVEPTADGLGLWLLSSDGTVRVRGTARHHGNVDVSGLDAGERIASLAALPGGTGYWVFTDRGRAVEFGAAADHGDMSTTVLNGPIVASVATPTGQGFYMVGSDGGVFTFGDASFRGSMGAARLNEPVVGIAPDPDGVGYWLVASDGGIFAFDAAFRGSIPGVLAPGVALNRPIIGAVAFGDGYLMTASDGGIFSFSGAGFFGSLGGQGIPSPIRGFAAFAGC